MHELFNSFSKQASARRSMGPEIRGLTGCHLSEFLLAKKKRYHVTKNVAYSV